MRRSDLVPDCGRCAAVCCVAPSFEASTDFAVGKQAGVPCRHLGVECRCTIHDELVPRGFLGCSIYDCYGAGPRVTRLFVGATGLDAQRDEAFLFLRVVHELLWLLTEAAKLCPTSEVLLREQIEKEVATLDAIELLPFARADVDLRSCHERSQRLLVSVGHAVGGRARHVLRVMR
jgi:hypothetical protein